jgi:hypothetical protein
MKMSEKVELSREQFIKNQEAYCKEKGYPFFMPYNGMCWACGRDVVKSLIERGLRGKEDLVTGCPLCHRSYCD